MRASPVIPQRSGGCGTNLFMARRCQHVKLGGWQWGRDVFMAHLTGEHCCTSPLHPAPGSCCSLPGMEMELVLPPLYPNSGFWEERLDGLLDGSPGGEHS